MAEIAAVLGAAIKVVKWVGGPIIHQFNYFCCFTTNIKHLKDEAEKLDDAAEGIQVQVDRALEDVRVIVPQVKTWLAKSNNVKDQKTTILEQVPNVESGCLKLGARFSLSKRAKKTTNSMKELRDECIKFDVISLPGPPAAREAVQLGKTYEFESRKQIEEDIMTILRGGVVSVTGISGMGGLGKTTMAKRIMNRVLEEHVFEETVIAVVSQQVDKLKIQLEIGGSLGLNLQEETSEAGRKQKLHARLSGTKRILLVLDDVWEGVELEEFGIPRDSKGCTILITSRNRDALHAMDVQKEFRMEILCEDEAWFLFREKAGTCMDEADLKSIAERVVKECEGLPIALATVGASLKDEKNPSVWRDALRQLSQCVPDIIPDFLAKVYNPLKLSYDCLSSKQAKSLFLLCCLYPEDADIKVEELTHFGMGLGLFAGIGNLEEVRDRVFTLIKMLKSRSLLLDSEVRNGYVRMHDVVHDVCKIIATREKYVGGNDCQWISSFELVGEKTELSTGLGYQNLRLLLLSCEAFKLDATFFEGICDLYVLSIRRYKSLTSLPLTHSLKNLKSLVLDSCDGLETISVIGEFVNLEILICRTCPLIEELSLETKRLNRLKLLELTECKNLQRIGQGIISSLIGLEELKMLNSFKRWESEDREERENAGIRELEALTNLRQLVIEIEDPAVAAETMHLSSKINRFHIIIGTVETLDDDDDGGDDDDDDDDDSYFLNDVDNSYEKMLLLLLGLKREQPCLGHSIEMQLLRETEVLFLMGNGANRVDLAKCQNIKWLVFQDCKTVKNIITTSMVDDATTSIDHLYLRYLPKLEVICDGPVSFKSFHNLKELRLFRLKALKQLWKSGNPPLFTNLSSINITRCHQLCNLGQLSIAGKDCLPQLEKLVIRKCERMEQVFLWNEEAESNNPYCFTQVFPKLKKVMLYHLPNLATFYQGTCGFKYPLLTELSIRECPKLESIGSNHNIGGSSVDIDDISSHLFCQPKKVSFTNLKELLLANYEWNPFCGHKIPFSLLNGLEVLKLSKLHRGGSLFSTSVAGNLVNLRELNISFCDEMLNVIEDNKEMIEEENVVSGTAQMPLFIFPKLEELKLKDLPKLVTFCEWKCDIKLPLLSRVTMMRCPNMENLSLGFLAAPDLETFITDFNNDLRVNVSFNSPNMLVVKESEKPFYGHKFFLSIFNGLKELRIYSCDASMSFLFTSSIARRLGSLEKLYIQDCKEMVKVIEDEDEDDEKVGSGGERTLLFPKLKNFVLDDLPKLVSFSQRKCDIELPSLRYVGIYKCPVLRIFTMGSIAAAPNLKNVQMEEDYNFGGDTKDLNSVVQHYMKLREQLGEWSKELLEVLKKILEMKGGEKEEEIKSEIEEEPQN